MNARLARWCLARKKYPHSFLKNFTKILLRYRQKHGFTLGTATLNDVPLATRVKPTVPQNPWEIHEREVGSLVPREKNTRTPSLRISLKLFYVIVYQKHGFYTGHCNLYYEPYASPLPLFGPNGVKSHVTFLILNARLKNSYTHLARKTKSHHCQHRFSFDILYLACKASFTAWAESRVDRGFPPSPHAGVSTVMPSLLFLPPVENRNHYSFE